MSTIDIEIPPMTWWESARMWVETGIYSTMMVVAVFVGIMTITNKLIADEMIAELVGLAVYTGWWIYTVHMLRD